MGLALVRKPGHAELAGKGNGLGQLWSTREICE
jgi:hypothetical protein